MLLTLPAPPEQEPKDFVRTERLANGRILVNFPGGSRESFATQEEANAEIERVARNMRKMERPGAFKSSHWDQPNVLAHIRLNDRTDADGKRVLFVEEIQSDWGQEGKKKGFADKKEQELIRKELEPYGVQPTGSTSYSLLKSKGVPDELIDRWDNAYMRALS